MIKIKQLFDEITKQKVYPITTLKAVKDPKSKKSLSDLMIVGEGEEIIGELGKRDCDTLGGKYKSTDIDSAMTCDEDEELGVVEDVTIVDADRLGGKYTADDIDKMFSNCYAKLKVIGDTGCIITLSDGQSGVIDASGSIVFSVYYGEYTIQVTKGGITNTYTVTIDTLKIYELAVVGFNITNWLRAGKISTDYASVSEIPEKDIRQLMTIHSSVDYLVGNIKESCVDVATELLNNDICAKWINLRDYALDMLYTNPVAKSIMDNLGKYGYGEWALLPQVPTMTSNTAPYGEVSASSQQGEYYAYKLFDGQSSNGSAHSWSPNENTGSAGTSWIQYRFTRPVLVKRVHIVQELNTHRGVKEFEILASNNGIDFDTLGTFIAEDKNDGTIQYFDLVTNNKEYLIYRLHPLTTYENLDVVICQLQFYAWGAKGAVPVMTSDTAPYGTVTVSSVYSGNAGYAVFNDSYNNNWSSSSGSSSQWICYEFVNPVCVRSYYILSNTTDRITDWKLQASNDKSTWVDLDTKHSSEIVDNLYKVSNNEYYKFYRIYVTGANRGLYDYGCTIYTIQFYGRQLNVSVPVMTSNTAPWGEAIGNKEFSDGNPFVAFDKDETTFWYAKYEYGKSLGYNFKKPVKLGFISVKNRNFSGVYVVNFKIQGSNDEVAWDDLGDFTNTVTTSSGVSTYYVSSETAYKCFRMVMLSGVYNSSTGEYYQIAEVQFYGVDYSEREFEEGSTMKYIYDHGVELEEIIQNGSGGTFAKNPYSIECNDTSTSDHVLAVIKNSIDLTPFSLIRCNTLKGTSINSIGMIALVKNIGDTTTPVYRFFETNLAPNNQYCDISSVNEEYHINISASTDTTTGNVEFSEWWLE